MMLRMPVENSCRDRPAARISKNTIKPRRIEDIFGEESISGRFFFMFLMTLCLWSSDVVNIHGLDIYRHNARVMAVI